MKHKSLLIFFVFLLATALLLFLANDSKAMAEAILMMVSELLLSALMERLMRI